MENEVTRKYYEYMRENENLKVGTYEARQLAKECGIDVKILIFLGARVNATQVPIAIKDGWYIYTLAERIIEGETKYYIFIVNSLNYL